MYRTGAGPASPTWIKYRRIPQQIVSYHLELSCFRNEKKNRQPSTLCTSGTLNFASAGPVQREKEEQTINKPRTRVDTPQQHIFNRAIYMYVSIDTHSQTCFIQQQASIDTRANLFNKLSYNRCRSTPWQTYSIKQQVSIDMLANLLNRPIGIDWYHCKPIVLINRYRSTVIKRYCSNERFLGILFILCWCPRELSIDTFTIISAAQ